MNILVILTIKKIECLNFVYKTSYIDEYISNINNKKKIECLDFVYKT